MGKHVAVQSSARAIKWSIDSDGDLRTYVRAMAAAFELETCAARVRELRRRHNQLEISALELQLDCPGFVYTLGALVLPVLDTTALAEHIVCDDSAEMRNRPEGTGLVKIFLDRLFNEHCNEQLRLTWIPPSKKGSRDGMVTVLGNEPCEREQLAWLVAEGVGKILQLRPLERFEVPIAAVAAGIEEPAKQSDDALRDEFERRADRWRQKSNLIALRLRKLLAGLVSLSQEALRSLFSGEPLKSYGRTERRPARRTPRA